MSFRLGRREGQVGGTGLLRYAPRFCCMGKYGGGKRVFAGRGNLNNFAI